MRTLLLQPPLSPPGPQAVYGQAWVDTPAARKPPAFAPLGLLPAVDRHTAVVMVLPAAALSWQRVRLPAGVGRNSQRLQAALQGLLEERLLQDITQVHIALPPRWTPNETLWVAVCDKAWLLGHLQALEEAQLPVQRLVPEFSPPAEGSCWHAVGPADGGWLWCRSAETGVHGWPVSAAVQLPAAWIGDASVEAEPAQASWAQGWRGQQVRLVETASHWVQALDSGWDLAQFDLALRLRQRRLLRWRQRYDAWRRNPWWRPARWGLLAVLLAQLLGLNAWAWMTRLQWERQQDSWTRLLQESFPKVTVVVDAPLQMRNEIGRLRQGSGQLSPTDFESLLQALGTALPAGVSGPAGLQYQDGVLQWPALEMNAAQTSAFEQALGRQGYALQVQGDQWRLQSREARP